jgi:hypothetical protein
MNNDVSVWHCNGQEFYPGTRVRVARIEQDFAPNGMGEGYKWDDVWINKLNGDPPYTSMDEAVGMEFEIAYIDSEGAHFMEYTGSFIERFAYPLSALDVVSYSGRVNVQKEAA